MAQDKGVDLVRQRCEVGPHGDKEDSVGGFAAIARQVAFEHLSYLGCCRTVNASDLNLRMQVGT